METPVWFFPEGILNTYMAVAASHEAGHTFGCNHDGNTFTGEVYYEPMYPPGKTSWGPIMGAPFFKFTNLGQWSEGEYPYANNHEDHLAMRALKVPVIGSRGVEPRHWLLQSDQLEKTENRRKTEHRPGVGMNLKLPVTPGAARAPSSTSCAAC